MCQNCSSAEWQSCVWLENTFRFCPTGHSNYYPNYSRYLEGKTDRALIIRQKSMETWILEHHTGCLHWHVHTLGRFLFLDPKDIGGWLQCAVPKKTLAQCYHVRIGSNFLLQMLVCLTISLCLFWLSGRSVGLIFLFNIQYISQ